MRVVEAVKFGGPDVLRTREVPDAVAGAGQVVIEVAAADTLFVETQIRAGIGSEYWGIEPPYVPGNGVAGRVSAVGAGVDPAWAGRAVAAHTGGARGAYASRAVVDADALVDVPSGLELTDAAALLHDGPTALALLDKVGAPRQGGWALVLGAAGGMGLVLVQLLAGAGARVVGAARGAEKLAAVRSLGAEAVDYSAPEWVAEVRSLVGDSGVEVVFDGVGGELGRAAFGLVTPGGRFSAHGMPSGSFTGLDQPDATAAGITLTRIEQVQLAPGELRQTTARALAAAADGRIRPFVGRTYPLERAGEAHAAIENRQVVGKTLLLA
ncbi:MDR/zinc-dependent alcohol dehydrogenase-like family protein [Flindersiella endophytica]